MTLAWRLRAALLALAGALAVHEGQALFAAPEHEHALAGAHAYLAWLVPATGALLVLACSHAATHVLGGGRCAVPTLPRAGVLWATAAGGLTAAYFAQESLETLLTHGHLPVAAELLAHGGWIAIPLAAPAGG